MKKITALALAVLMVLALCACGSSNENKDLYGTYKLYAMDYDETTTLFAEELFSGENYVTLKSGGAAEMCMEDEVANVKWKAGGTKLTITADDGDMEGSISNGILTLIADGSNLYFVGEGASTDSIKAITLDEMLNGVVNDVINGTEDQPETPEQPDTPAKPEATPAPAPTQQPEPAAVKTETEVQKKWNGWWYGFADINGCEGGWEWANGSSFDMAMHVELDENGNGTFGIHDPYGEMAQGPNNNRFITIKCHADTNYIYGESGTTFGYDIEPSDWIVVHMLNRDDMIFVGSSHTDDDGNKMGYDFIFMPWGSTWEGESFSYYFQHFDDYLDMLDAGMTNPFDNGESGEGGGGETPAAPTGASTGTHSALLGSAPEKLNINGKDAVYVYYPADQFRYDDDYGKLKNDDTGLGILIDPMLGATNFEELKASYEENNSDEDDYSLVETTVNGYRAQVMKYSDWLGATMRVDVDFGGNHDGFYGMSFAVSGDSLEDCDTELVWAIIESMKIVK